MIAAVVDFSTFEFERYVFRGRDLSYWISRQFESFSFFPIKRIPSTFNILMVFDSSVFLDVDSIGIEEIKTYLEGKGRIEDGICSLRGYPFLGVSRKFFNQSKNIFKKGVFKVLKDRHKIELFSLRSYHDVLTMERDILKIEHAIMKFQIRSLYEKGVIIQDHSNFYLEGNIPVGEGTVLSSGVIIRGNCDIGKNVTIYPHCYIENSKIGNNVVLLPGTVVRDSLIEEGSQIGPYTHLRNGSVVKRGAKMGNFVEMKKSILGQRSKSMHLSYIGDAKIGKDVNVGAGTITCNFDGEKKHKTIIKDNVFVGSGSELVAPVTVNKNSYIGAGSTITKDVPENTLALNRGRQKNIQDWVTKKKKKDR